MCFRLACSPVLCAMDFVLSFTAFISLRLDMFRKYRDCMFRSQWLKDAKFANFKSLVANDWTYWCLKDRKAETESAFSLEANVWP